MSCENADVYTYGFSNRTWEETLEILDAYHIECLVDVRSLPGSRKYPHFNREILESSLPAAGIRYVHLAKLGGYRKASNNGDQNAGWRNSSFRNYADYMQTAAFGEGLSELVEVFQSSTAVYVCTEAVYWRCHRMLISDALLVRSFHPGHIFTKSKCELHNLTKFARVQDQTISYPATD